jgi:hypothetical protein
MIDGRKGDLANVDQGLCVIQPHQKRPHEARSHCHRHPVQIPHAYRGLGQGRLNHRHNILEVFPGCELRNHTAMGVMELYLGVNHTGQNPPPIGDDTGGGIVAGGVYSQNDHGARYLPHQIKG